MVRRGIGDFATAWGYSVDLGAQLQLGRVRLGMNIQDATSMIQAWSVNDEAFAALGDDERPVGLVEVVLPVARLGAATRIELSEDIGTTFAADLDLGFDGQKANVFNAGEVSFRPRIGGELTFKDAIAFRAGIADITTNEEFGTQITPSVGAGFKVGGLALDYGFGDFGGLQSELGYAHRVSIAYKLDGTSFSRSR